MSVAASVPSPDPQSQPPLLRDSDDEDGPTQGIHHSGAHANPLQHQQPRLSSLSHPAGGTAAESITLSPTRYNLASSPGEPHSESMSNFMKYGSIRPPLSVLKEEFLDTYRIWREHTEPLEGIERPGGLAVVGRDGREQSGVLTGGRDAWAGHMSSVHTMYARYDGRVGQLTQGQIDVHDTESELFELTGFGLSEAKDEEKDEDGCIIDDENSTTDSDDTERNQLKKLAALMFRPGAKLSGTMLTKKDKIRGCHYELVVMEGEKMDELGRPKGVLARHKCLGDEQCVFVKLSFVQVTECMEDPDDEGADSEEEKEAIKDEEDTSDEVTSVENNDGRVSRDSGPKAPSQKRLTMKIEYADGDSLVQGLWNHYTLCFEGTDTKLSEAQGDSNQLGGTIISGLISGHSSFADGGGADEDESQARRRHSFLRRPPTTNKGTRTFSLSPCTHLHPKGVAPTPPWLALSETLERVTLHGTYAPGSLALVDASQRSDTNAYSTEKRQELVDEIASLDNAKLVLHRARTDALRRETLTKLVELGAIVDFAELARKRNVAHRREKWRGRARKYKPRVPQRLRRKKKTSTTTADDLSKEKNKVHFHDQLAAIAWGELLEEASVQCECTCAEFRRQTALLAGLTFDSDEYKAQIMADLRAGGLSLSNSHSEWDRCIQMGRTVALGWSWFERGSWSCFERSAVVGKRCVFLLFQMHSRLEANHKGLEKAFRGADGRLTLAQLEKIRNGTLALSEDKREVDKGAEDECEGLCGICQCDIDEDASPTNGEEDKAPTARETTQLPCSHSFHWLCIREWLHDHSQCPICRVELNK